MPPIAILLVVRARNPVASLWGVPIVRAVNPATAATSDLVPDSDLVAGLLRQQVPHLADLALRPSPASGSSNWVFRLGDTRAVRLPRSDGYERDLLKEVRWLPRLGPALSVPVPEVEFVGEASNHFPRP